MKKIKLAMTLALMCIASAGAIAQELVGQTGWAYLDSPSCSKKQPNIYDRPSVASGIEIPWPDGQWRFKVIKNEGLFYRVEFDDGRQAFMQTHALELVARKIEPKFLSVYCVGFIEPEVRERAISEYEQKEAAFRKDIKDQRAKTAQERNELRAKPDAKIGMTAAQVIESTSWGRPDGVNKTVTATGTEEQWVYAYGYLYFKGGRLTAIHTRE